MDQPLVSVIIPTRNSSRTLNACLKSVRSQTYQNIEILVVDSYSNDGTPEIAMHYGAKVIQVVCERSRAKNIGLKLSRGKYVLFIDSDMELEPSLISECVELSESNPKLGGIIIPERSIGRGWWARVRDFERSFYAGTPIESARFFRRDLALEVNGYDEDLIFFEESTLPQKIERLGFRVDFRVKSLIYHHEEDLSLITLLKKKYYYGKTLVRYAKRYRERSTFQLSPIYRLSIFLRKKEFYKNPHLALSILILKALELASIVMGYLSERVKELKTFLAFTPKSSDKGKQPVCQDS